MKLQQGRGNACAIGGGANGRQKGRIRAIRNNHRIINKKKENFQRVSSSIKMITKEAKGKKINTDIKGKRGRERGHRRCIRQKRNNRQRRKIKTKRERTNKTSINVMVNSMKRIREKNMRSRRCKIKKIVSRNQSGNVTIRKMMAKKIITVGRMIEKSIKKESKREIVKITNSLRGKNPMFFRKKCKAWMNVIRRRIKRERRETEGRRQFIIGTRRETKWGKSSSMVRVMGKKNK